MSIALPASIFMAIRCSFDAPVMSRFRLSKSTGARRSFVLGIALTLCSLSQLSGSPSSRAISRARAPGSPTASVRSVFAAAATLGACSACTTTASSASRVSTNSFRDLDRCAAALAVRGRRVLVHVRCLGHVCVGTAVEGALGGDCHRGATRRRALQTCEKTVFFAHSCRVIRLSSPRWRGTCTPITRGLQLLRFIPTYVGEQGSRRCSACVTTRGLSVWPDLLGI